MTSSDLGPAIQTSLVAELADTLDALIDRPLVGAALFGAERPAIGRYAIEHRLGAGATAVVYAARDTTLDRPVALKIVAGRDLSGAWCVRAHREARALARLSHPNVVAVYDVGEWQEHSYIAMELVVGSTLAQWQAAARRPAAAILRRYLAAGRGLEAAHSVGLVHRDFKPANVLVADSDRVVVTDFGLATLAAASGAREAGAASRVGTPAYLPPEQGAGAFPRPCADVYSFSVALCEALVGQHPFLVPGFDWRRELAAAGLPRRTRRAIERGMATEAEQRWPNLGPLLAALEAALPGSRRSRIVAAAGFGLGLAAVFAGATWRELSAAGASANQTAAATRGDRDEASDASRAQGLIAIARAHLAGDPTTAAAALLEVPMNQRGHDWGAAARAALMRPLARELRCVEEAPARFLSGVSHGLLAAVDAGGRALVCDLAADRVTPLLDNAVCAQVLSGDHVGVLTAEGELAVFERDSSWRLLGQLPMGSPWPGARAEGAECERDIAIMGPRSIALRSGGASWYLVDLAVPLGLHAPSTADHIEAGHPARIPVAISRDRRRVLLRHPGMGTMIQPLVAPVRNPARHFGAWFVAYEPISRVAVGLRGDNGVLVELLDVEADAVIESDRLAPGGAPAALEIAPDGRTAVVATSRGMLAWRPLSGDSRAPWSEVVSEHRIAQLAFNRASTRLVWKDTSGSIGVRDVGRASGHELPAGARLICNVAFATDDRVVAVGCDGRVLAWDLAEERTFLAGRHDLAHCRPRCDEASKAIWSASVDAAGSLVATAGVDGTVGVWPLDRGSTAQGRRLSIGAGRRAYITKFDGDRLLIGARGGAAQIWDWRTGRQLAELPGHHIWVYAIEVARPANGPVTIVTGDKGPAVRFWQADGLHLRATAALPWKDASIHDLAVSPSGRRVAAGTTAEVAIYDTSTGAPITRISAHRGWARRVLFVDEDVLLSAGDDGVVQRIAIPSGAIISSIRAHYGPIYDIDRLGDRLLTASLDGSIRLWDLRTGAHLRTYVGHEKSVGFVRWHPSGEWFVSASGDHRACVWRVERDTCDTWLIGHRDEVRTPHIVGDSTIVTPSRDGTVRVWNLLPSGTIEHLSAELERRAPACLDAHQPVSGLGELAEPARAVARACGYGVR